MQGISSLRGIPPRGGSRGGQKTRVFWVFRGFLKNLNIFLILRKIWGNHIQHGLRLSGGSPQRVHDPAAVVKNRCLWSDDYIICLCECCFQERGSFVCPYRPKAPSNSAAGYPLLPFQPQLVHFLARSIIDDCYFNHLHLSRVEQNFLRMKFIFSRGEKIRGHRGHLRGSAPPPQKPPKNPPPQKPPPPLSKAD